MSETMNDKQLTAIFQLAGSKYGFDEVCAEFAPFRDFKVKWTRTYRWISLEVSDYLEDAPEEVLRSLAESIFKKIQGDEGTQYNEDVVNWLTSDDFVMNHQETYVRRIRGRDTNQDVRKLLDSYGRLIREGLVKNDPNIMLEWNRNERTRRIGSSSVLMRYGQLNSILCDDEVSDELLDYCVFSQIVHIQMGFNNSGASKGQEYDELLNRFPQRSRMESMLREMGLSL